jgi:peptidyl-prolyl cis-trans isomerase A (cyclophilin A)
LIPALHLFYQPLFSCFQAHHMYPTLPIPSPSRSLFKLHRYAVSSLLAMMALLPTSGWAQTVKLATSMGDIVLELNAELAPKTVANFVQYVRSGHYDGTVFHRVIETFMIQAGGHKADMTEKPTRAPIALESSNGLSNMRGTIAMARTGNPNSATAQFFINVNDNVMLDKTNATDGNGYAVFGKVLEGMDVVDKIRAVPTKEMGPHQNVPAKPVTIKKATVEK